MSTIHPQHLVLRRAEAQAASWMETHEKRGLSLSLSQSSSKMGPPRICMLVVFTLLFFLASTKRCCRVFPGPDFWHCSHSSSLVTVTDTQRDRLTVSDGLTSPHRWDHSPPCNICSYGVILLCQAPYFDLPQITKKVKNHWTKTKSKKLIVTHT